MSADPGLRDQLAEVVLSNGADSVEDAYVFADALLPVVERHARTTAARELRDAAAEAQRLGLLPGNVHGFFTARADRLEAGQ